MSWILHDHQYISSVPDLRGDSSLQWDINGHLGRARFMSWRVSVESQGGRVPIGHTLA